MGRPSIDQMTAPVPQQVSIPLLNSDQRAVNGNGAPIRLSLPVDFRSVAVDQIHQFPLPPSPSPPSLPSVLLVGPNPVSQPNRPQPGPLEKTFGNPFGIINKDRILVVEGFQPIERRFATAKRKRSMLQRKLSNRLKRGSI